MDLQEDMCLADQLNIDKDLLYTLAENNAYWRSALKFWVNVAKKTPNQCTPHQLFLAQTLSAQVEEEQNEKGS